MPDDSAPPPGGQPPPLPEDPAELFAAPSLRGPDSGLGRLASERELPEPLPLHASASLPQASPPQASTREERPEPPAPPPSQPWLGIHSPHLAGATTGDPRSSEMSETPPGDLLRDRSGSGGPGRLSKLQVLTGGAARSWARTPPGFQRVVQRALQSPRAVYVLLALFLTTLQQSWYVAGTHIATGDVGLFLPRSLSTVIQLWNYTETSAGSATYGVARIHESLLVAVVTALGGTNTLAQRLLYTICFVGAALAGAYLAAAFVRSRRAVFTAGLITAVNPFLLTHLPNTLVLLGLAVPAVLCGAVLRCAGGQRVRALPLALASLILAPLVSNPPVLAVSVLVIFAVIAIAPLVSAGGALREGYARVGRLVARALPVVIALHLFWVVPTIIVFTTGSTTVTATTDVRSWAWTHVNSSLQNVAGLSANWAFGRPEYFPATTSLGSGPISLLPLVLPLAVLAAPLLASGRLRRVALGVALVCVPLVFFGKGLHPPFGAVNLWLYDHIPGLFLLREPMAKIGPLLILLYSINTAIALQGLFERIRGRDWGIRLGGGAVALGVVVSVLVYNAPLVTGSVIPDERPIFPSAHVTLPQGWVDAAAVMNADPAAGKALVLPLDDYYQIPVTWGFYGVDSLPRQLIDRPVVAFAPGGYYGDSPGFAAQVRALEDALELGQGADARALMDSLGLRYVALRNDIDRTVLTDRSFADTTRLTRGLGRVAGVSKRHAGLVDVYQVAGDEQPPGRVNSGARLHANGEMYRLAASEGVRSRDPGEGGVASATGTSSTAGAQRRAEEARAAARRAATQAAAVTALPPGSHLVEAPGGETSPATLEVAARTDLLASQQLTLAGGSYLAQSHVTARLPYTVSLSSPTTVSLTFAARLRLDTTAIPGPAGVELRVPPATRAVGIGPQLTALREDARVFLGGEEQLDTYQQASTTEVRFAEPAGNCARSRDTSDARAQITRDLSAGGTAVEVGASDDIGCVRGRVAVTPAPPGERRTFLLEGTAQSVTGQPARLCVQVTVPRGSFCDATSPRLDAASVGGRPQVISQVFTVPAEVQMLTVFAYADHTQDGPRTRARYEQLRISELRSGPPAALPPRPVPPVTLKLAPGEHTLTAADGGRGQNLLAPFGPVGDCNAYDERSLREAGIRAELQDPSRLTLQADVHSACVNTGADVSSASQLRLRFVTTRLSGKPGRICLMLLPNPGCAALPALPPGDEGFPSTYEQVVQLPAGAQRAVLYLYADGAGEEEEASVPTVVRFEEVSLEAVVPLSFTLRQLTPPAPGQGSVLRETSQPRAGRLSAVLSPTPAPVLLGLYDNASSQWRLRGAGATPVVVDGYAQGWVIPQGRDTREIEVIYRAEQVARGAGLVSLLTLLGVGGWLIAAPLRRRLRARPAERAAETGEPGAQPRWASIQGRRACI